VSRVARIVIAMRTLRPGRMGGSETYAGGLVRGLAEHGTLEYVCLVPPAAPSVGDALPTVVGRDRALRAADAVHYPFTIPLPRLGVPSAVTLFDLLHRDRPELVPASTRVFRLFAYDRAARRAALVICLSEYIRGRIHERLRITLDRIRAIHPGVDHEVFRPAQERREPFLLYPARPWPHKNHARLFEAFALLRRERPELELVLTGGDHDVGALPPGVRSLGRVPRAELAALYRRAAALVFPSLHEGFGQPPLEAMACGCPVACSNTTSLPEICGDAAVYFDPNAADEIADAVLRVVDRPGDLARRGLARAARFTWDRAARTHEDAYREIAASA
jgi:glycosyltransferase involved in cell wall biosynthesis